MHSHFQHLSPHQPAVFSRNKPTLPLVQHRFLWYQPHLEVLTQRSVFLLLLSHYTRALYLQPLQSQKSRLHHLPLLSKPVQEGHLLPQLNHQNHVGCQVLPLSRLLKTLSVSRLRAVAWIKLKLPSSRFKSAPLLSPWHNQLGQMVRVMYRGSHLELKTFML